MTTVPLGPGPVIVDPFKITVTNNSPDTFPLVSHSVTSTPAHDTTVDEKPGHELRNQDSAVLAWRFNNEATSTLFNFPGTTGTVVYKLTQVEAAITEVGFRIVVEPFAGIPPEGSQLSHFEYEILTLGGVEQPSDSWIAPASGALAPFTFTAPTDSLPSYRITVTPSTDESGYQIQVVIESSLIQPGAESTAA